MSKYNYLFVNPTMLSATLEESKKQRLLDKKLSFTQVDNAYIIPSKDRWVNGQWGGVISAKGEFIMSSAWFEGRRFNKYNFEDKDVTYYDETVIYMGVFSACWGHAITDSLKKLWFLKTQLCKDLCKQGAKLVYITFGNDSLPQYVHKLFELTTKNLSEMRQITEISQFKTVIVPDNSFIADEDERYFTQEFRSTCQDIRNNVRIRNTFSPKIYFSRTKFKQNWLRDYGEKDIEREFKRLGYQILYPETLSPEEQICAAMHCTHFAATEGSISHNSIFCTPGTNVTIIRKANFINPWQIVINEIADLNVTYVDANNSILSRATIGPYYMCINSEFCHYIGHYIPHLPLWLRPSWYRYKYQLEGRRDYQKMIRGISKIKKLFKIQFIFCKSNDIIKFTRVNHK